METEIKPASEWVDENSQSGAFDLVEGIEEAELLIQRVQSNCCKATCGVLLKEMGDLLEGSGVDTLEKVRNEIRRLIRLLGEITKKS